MSSDVSVSDLLNRLDRQEKTIRKLANKIENLESDLRAAQPKIRTVDTSNGPKVIVEAGQRWLSPEYLRTVVDNIEDSDDDGKNGNDGDDLLGDLDR